MKKTVVTLLVGTVAAMGVMTGCGNGQGTAKLVTPQDSAAYFLGLSQTMPLHEQWDQYQYQVPGDSASKKDQFIQGFRDALTSGSAKAAYSNGYLMGFQLIDSWEGFNARIPGDSLDKQKFIDGLIAGLSGKVDTTLTMDAINNYMQDYFANAQKIVEDQNKKAGADFLAANKSKDGVVELPSG